MTAARFAPGTGLALQEVPVPEPGPGEALVRVEACGICLSDVHLIDGSIPPVVDVVTPGHESAGTIERLGPGVTGWTPGDRVAISGGRPCGRCPLCISGRADDCLRFEIMGFHYDGAWAELVVVPAACLAAVADGVPAEQAAILADAVATPFAALADTARLRPGESIGLWGIGGLGTHAVMLARMMGAGLVVAVDPLPSARSRALTLGADVAVDPAADVRREIRGLTGDQGLDIAIDLVGSNDVLREAVSCLRPGGRAVMVGLSLEPVLLGPGVLFGTRRTALLGHLGYAKEHLDRLVALVASGRLDLSMSISDVIPLSEIASGVERLSSKHGDPVRIVVRP